MGKTEIRFNDEYAERYLKRYDKEYMLEYIERKLERSKKVIVKRLEQSTSTIYTIKLDEEELKIRFFKKYEKENERYTALFDYWYEKSRKSSILKLGITGTICTLALTGTVIICKDQIVKATDKIISSCSDFIDDQKFYLSNVKEVMSINELEAELRAHTGYGDVDGYSQSIKDHLNSLCYLDKSTTNGQIYDSILSYCDEHGLGDYVADKAIQKYDLLDEDNLSSAYDIELIEEYRKSLN